MTKGAADSTLVAKYNDLESVKALLASTPTPTITITIALTPTPTLTLTPTPTLTLTPTLALTPTPTLTLTLTLTLTSNMNPSACRKVADCLLEGLGGLASLGADYSGAWSNPWTFVITVVDAAGASLAIAPPTADLELGATQRPPVLNLSRALGLEQRSPLVGRTVSLNSGDRTYFWDMYDSVPPTCYADTPVELCQRAGKSDAWCSYARFLHVPPVPTNVTITADRLEPVIGATQVPPMCMCMCMHVQAWDVLSHASSSFTFTHLRRLPCLHPPAPPAQPPSPPCASPGARARRRAAAQRRRHVAARAERRLAHPARQHGERRGAARRVTHRQRP